MTEAIIKSALSNVKYPGFSRDIVAFGLVKDIKIDGSDVEVTISIQTKDPKVPETIFKECQDALNQIDGIGTTRVNVDVKNPEAQAGGDQSTAGGKTSIPGVKQIIAVASGKGGVGKSTISTNLAVALAKTGAKVGLCDCDLYGPSTAQMFGTKQQPLANERDEIIPIEAHGIKLMSMSFLLDDNSPVIVRGPLATRYTQQFLRQVEWGELDYLILDLPPGTGDIQLTIVQTVALSGVVIVTTPQEVALIDARKAASMFAKVNVDILGVVENMAWFECDHGTRYPIFGEGGGVREAERLKVPLLGQIPIDVQTRECADNGTPIALLSETNSTVSAAFKETAAKVVARVQR
ncbi:Mrp/NBP35 family ATP-binding protein [Rubritalea profundi]|uniref:Iron-sulfur cluster carrier protein n=1 Tax=Rubritalea profundi TaxID=1658618 RepID=A0A2S7TY76_9BACT|nr:Mrp/NBP35 family ATP-binding protein [Rubritalea profundi]PQJ27705.1 chromosome partitioning protein [Rubritalea profundi]